MSVMSLLEEGTGEIRSFQISCPALFVILFGLLNPMFISPQNMSRRQRIAEQRGRLLEAIQVKKIG